MTGKKCQCGKSKTGFCDGSHANVEETTFSLAGTETIDKNSAYLVDFGKLNSVNDLVLILSAIGFTFRGDHPFIETIKPFLNLENPIPLPPVPQSKQQPAELKLPKLKTL